MNQPCLACCPKRAIPMAMAVLLLLAVIVAGPAFAQDDGPATIGETDIRPFTYGGSIGFLSEAYTVSGRPARRPPAMGRISANTRFSLFGMQSGINLLYSTDDNALRQSANRFYFHGSWRWLTLAVGDVSPRFSKYSLGGVTVRGGMITLKPRGFTLMATGGRTKRKVDYRDEPGFRQPAFEQWLYAARIGFGKQDGTQFALSAVYAYDVSTSIENWGNIYPAENLNFTPELNFSLFKGALRLENSVTVSLFSSDVTTTAYELDDVPGSDVLTQLFTPRTGSRVDYAADMSMRLQAGPFRMSGSFERVQPGFYSLGLGHIRSDQQMLRFRPQIRLGKGRVNIGGNVQHSRNNLLESRLLTVTRQQLGGNVHVRATNMLNFMFSYMQMNNANNPVDPTLPGMAEMQQEQMSRNFMFAPSLVIMSGPMTHTISVNSAYQTLDDQSQAALDGIRQPISFTNITTGLSYGTMLPGGLNMSLSGNYIHNEVQTTTNRGYAINTSSGYSFLENRLSTNVSVGWSRNGVEYVQIVEEPLPDPDLPVNGDPSHPNGPLEGEYIVRQWSRQLTMNLSASYRLPNGNPIRFMIRGLLSKAPEGTGRDFNEMQATLRYDHRF